MATNTTTTLNDFEIICKLGDGSFAEVFKVLRKQDTQLYAMKKVRMARIKQKDRNNALNEIRILASEKRQNVVEFKEAFYDDSTSTLCIVMQYAQKGDLLKLIQSHLKKRTKIPESEIWKALVHMTKGLKSLHDKKILHRDLKGANVFITGEGVYKLGDLNVSKVIKCDFAKTQTGTPYYASPEVWKDQPYGVKSDMWSLGCVIYEMAAQRPPFTGNNIRQLYKKIMAGQYPRIPSEYSNQLAGIISILLKLDPAQRPTASSLLSNPVVQCHCQGQYKESMNWGNDELLETIKWQNRNMKLLNEVLPKPCYERRKTMQNHKNFMVDSFYMDDELDLNIKKENNYINSQKDKVKSLHEKQQKHCLKQHSSNVLKRQRVVTNYEPSKKVDGSSIDQIQLFIQLSSRQKNTKKQPQQMKRSPTTPKSVIQQSMPPKLTQSNKKAIDNLVSKILDQNQLPLKNRGHLRKIGQEIINSSVTTSRQDIAQYR